jgi:hypothetical protein
MPRATLRVSLQQRTEHRVARLRKGRACAFSRYIRAASNNAIAQRVPRSDCDLRTIAANDISCSFAGAENIFLSEREFCPETAWKAPANENHCSCGGHGLRAQRASHCATGLSREEKMMRHDDRKRVFAVGCPT